jgi:hypothetical protein
LTASEDGSEDELLDDLDMIEDWEDRLLADSLSHCYFREVVSDGIYTLLCSSKHLTIENVVSPAVSFLSTLPFSSALTHSSVSFFVQPSKEILFLFKHLLACDFIDGSHYPVSNVLDHPYFMNYCWLIDPKFLSHSVIDFQLKSDLNEIMILYDVLRSFLFLTKSYLVILRVKAWLSDVMIVNLGDCIVSFGILISLIQRALVQYVALCGAFDQVKVMGFFLDVSSKIILSIAFPCNLLSAVSSVYSEHCQHSLSSSLSPYLALSYFTLPHDSSQDCVEIKRLKPSGSGSEYLWIAEACSWLNFLLLRWLFMHFSRLRSHVQWHWGNILCNGMRLQ